MERQIKVGEKALTMDREREPESLVSLTNDYAFTPAENTLADAAVAKIDKNIGVCRGGDQGKRKKSDIIFHYYHA